MKQIIRTCLFAGIMTFGFTLQSSAEILVLEDVVNGDFETPAIGTTAAGLASWNNRATNANTQETTNSAEYANTAGVASQVASLYSNDPNPTSWFNQTLRATTDNNAAVHDLIVDEAAGDSILYSVRLGIRAFDPNGWPTAHQAVTIALFSDTYWNNPHESVSIYTGTEAQAITAGVTADQYLGLDDSIIGGASVIWSHIYVIPDAPYAPYKVLVLSHNTSPRSGGAGSKATVTFDDISVQLPPAKGTMIIIQ